MSLNNLHNKEIYLPFKTKRASEVGICNDPLVFINDSLINILDFRNEILENKASKIFTDYETYSKLDESLQNSLFYYRSISDNIQNKALTELVFIDYYQSFTNIDYLFSRLRKYNLTAQSCVYINFITSLEVDRFSINEDHLLWQKIVADLLRGLKFISKAQIEDSIFPFYNYQLISLFDPILSSSSLLTFDFLLKGSIPLFNKKNNRNKVNTIQISPNIFIELFQRVDTCVTKKFPLEEYKRLNTKMSKYKFLDYYFHVKSKNE